jgi:hypothetical protein
MPVPATNSVPAPKKATWANLLIFYIIVIITAHFLTKTALWTLLPTRVPRLHSGTGLLLDLMAAHRFFECETTARCAHPRMSHGALGTEHPSFGLNCMADQGFKSWGIDRAFGGH